MSYHADILTWVYGLLNTNVGSGVGVYKYDVPEEFNGNYILIRLEGGSQIDNKRSLADEVVLITDVVTRFQNNVDSSVVDTIDQLAYNIIRPSATAQTIRVTGAQVIDIKREQFQYLQEEDNANKYLRKVSRYPVKLFLTA